MIGAGFVNCGEPKEGEQIDEDAPVIPTGGIGNSSSSAQDDSVQMPQVGAIALGGFGETAVETALRLQGGETTADKKCEFPNLGAFGLAIGAACHTSPFASNLLLGDESGDFDGDGDIDCADFKKAEADKTGDEGGAGILMHLMCQGIFVANKDVVSFAFEEKKGTRDEAFVISFADYEGGEEAVGSWTKGNTASYPADIRFWNGESVSAVEPMLAMALKDLNNGTLSIERFDEKAINVKVEFSNNADASGCEAAPSKETCHWQDVQIYSGTGLSESGIPNGFHLRIFADSKENPKFIALQGRYSYSAETSAASFGKDGNTTLEKLRYIDFKTVKKGSQVWGQFEFTDENDAAFPWTIGTGAGAVDILAKFAAAEGICQNLDSDEWVTCTDITYGDYDALWDNKTDFVRIEASPIDVDWENKPTKPGLCNLKACIDF